MIRTADSNSTDKKESPSGRSFAKKIFSGQSSYLIIFIIVLSIVISLVNRNFIKPQNILNILGQISVVGIVASGMAIVLITGEFDISVGSQVSFMGAVLATLITGGANVFLTIIFVLAIGAGLGFINGIIVTKSKCASFIITLGTMTLYHGFVLVLTKGRNIPLQGEFLGLGRGLVFFIPIPILVFIAVLVLIGLALKYTRYGRTLFAVGGNKEAAYLSGVGVDFYKITAYMLCGLLSALASLVLISKLGASYPNTGDGYELSALASIVVGGVSLWGGKGSALGIFLGVVVFGVLSNALNMVNVSPYFRDVFTGLIIIVSVVMSRLGEQNR
jgi:ribose transport system permease protein